MLGIVDNPSRLPPKAGDRARGFQVVVCQSGAIGQMRTGVASSPRTFFRACIRIKQRETSQDATCACSSCSHHTHEAENVKPPHLLPRSELGCPKGGRVGKLKDCLNHLTKVLRTGDLGMSARCGKQAHDTPTNPLRDRSTHMESVTKHVDRDLLWPLSPAASHAIHANIA